MATLSRNALTGIGSCLPVRVVSNAEVAETIGVTEEWILGQSGIHERRWAGEDETVAVMGGRAAEQALAAAGITGEDVGFVIAATSSHLYQTPPLAPEIGQLVGAGRAPAFDLGAACAGFTHAVAVADAMVTAGAAPNVLVVATERMTDLVDPQDDHMAFLCGDGAGAALVAPSAHGGIGPAAWASRGDLRDVFRQVTPWPSARAAATGRTSLDMQGAVLYRFVVKNLPGIIETALLRAELKPGDVDVFVPHQANLRIIHEMLGRLGLRDDVVVARTISEMGNTSSASIPMALTALRDSGELRSGQIALLAGFGAGMSCSAQAIRIP